MTTTIAPTIMDENNTTTFTISDSNNGSNFYYKFTTPSGTTNNYGTITSTNGKNKTFTFQSNIIVGGANVTQDISYSIYNDYPYLSSTPTTHTISFTINNVESLPSHFIKLVDNSANQTVYVDISGNIVTGTNVQQNNTIKAIIDGITDADIVGGGQIPNTGSYIWYRSNNNSVALDGTVITGATTNTYTLTQDDVSKYIYVTYTYVDVGTHTNIAKSGKTNPVVNINDATTGDFYINEIYQTSVKDYAKFIVGANLTTVNTIKDNDVSFGTDAIYVKDSTIIKEYIWKRGTVVQSNNISASYTVVTGDVGNQMEVTYKYTDIYSSVTTVAGLLNGATSTINKTPTIINPITTTATIGTIYTHTISTVTMIDTDGLPLVLELATNPVWLSLNTLTFTLEGTPTLSRYIGPNTVTINFKSGATTRYTYEFIIIVLPIDVLPTYISISGDFSSTEDAGGQKNIINSVKPIPNTPASTVYTIGPIQTLKPFVNQIIITDASIIYNSTNRTYESDKLILSITNISTLPWLTISLNETDTETQNSSLTFNTDNALINNNTSILGNATTGYYFSSTTVPSASNFKYTWAIDISGTIPDNKAIIHNIATNIRDQYNSSNTIDSTFNFNIESQLFRYFLPDKTTRPIQGSYFEKYMFVTSTTGQNNISMVVIDKPSWMRIMLISTLNGAFIPTGIILMESINAISPGVCDSPGAFNIQLEIRDGTGLVIEFSNGTISQARQIGNYSSNDFSWMVLESPDQQRNVPRATAYPCLICGGENCTGNTFSKFQLDMRRKAETLAYKDKTFGFTKAQLISQMARSKQAKKKQWAAQSITNSYPNVNNYALSGNVLTCPNVGTGQPIRTSAAQSDVPGNKSFQLYMEQNVPIVGYIPVRRTYASSGQKYPERTYSPGDLGFPVGKSGRTPVKDTFLIIRFSISGITENMTTKFTSIENMFKLLFLGQRLSTDLSLDPIVATSSTSEFYSTQTSPSNTSGYIFTIKLLNRSLAEFRSFIETLFTNQIITIFNTFNFFTNNSNDFRNMCAKILSIDGSTDSSFVTSLNSSLLSICSSNAIATATP